MVASARLLLLGHCLEVARMRAVEGNKRPPLLNHRGEEHTFFDAPSLFGLLRRPVPQKRRLRTVCKGTTTFPMKLQRTSPQVIAVLALLSLSACRGGESRSNASEEVKSAEAALPPQKTTPEAAAPPAATAVEASVPGAAVGQTAPDFSLPDLDGKSVKLSEHKGKLVVLEWFNPSCPFVKASHTKGSLVDTAQRLTEGGVVFLAINSGAEGKPGSGKEANQAAKRNFGMAHPVLLDEDGKVGHLYGAAKTPHIFVIDEGGTLVYRGAVDNSPDGEGQSAEGGQLVSYLEQAVSALQENRPVSVPETKAYGCSVKYSQ